MVKTPKHPCSSIGILYTRILFALTSLTWCDGTELVVSWAQQVDYTFAVPMHSQTETEKIKFESHLKSLSKEKRSKRDEIYVGAVAGVVAEWSR